MTRLAVLLAILVAAVVAIWFVLLHWADFRGGYPGLTPPHVHEWTYMPVWKPDLSGIDGWWWCTNHEPGQWVRGDDEVAAA